MIFRCEFELHVAMYDCGMYFKAGYCHVLNVNMVTLSEWEMQRCTVSCHMPVALELKYHFSLIFLQCFHGYHV